MSLPPNVLTTVVDGQSFSSAKNDYAFTCYGEPIEDGPDLVFGVTTTGAGALTVRTSSFDAGLEMVLLAQSKCDGGSGALDCSNPTTSDVPAGVSFVTLDTATSYLFAEQINVGPTAGTNFSLTAHFNQAVSPGTDSCSPGPSPLPIFSGDVTESIYVTGTTKNSGADFPVPVGIGDRLCDPRVYPGLDPLGGEDDVLAFVPQSAGFLLVVAEAPPGSAPYQPVAWARRGGCEGGAVLGCSASFGDGVAFFAFEVLANETYYVVIDSLNAASSGKYFASFHLLPEADVTIEPAPARRPQGARRLVVRNKAGAVLRTLELASASR